MEEIDMMKSLANLQQQKAAQFGQMVDIYHTEEDRIIGVFPHAQPPTFFNCLEIINY